MTEIRQVQEEGADNERVWQTIEQQKEMQDTRCPFYVCALWILNVSSQEEQKNAKFNIKCLKEGPKCEIYGSIQGQRQKGEVYKEQIHLKSG